MKEVCWNDGGDVHGCCGVRRGINCSLRGVCLRGPWRWSLCDFERHGGCIMVCLGVHGGCVVSGVFGGPDSIYMGLKVV